VRTSAAWSAVGLREHHGEQHVYEADTHGDDAEKAQPAEQSLASGDPALPLELEERSQG